MPIDPEVFSKLNKATQIIRNPYIRNFVRQAGYQIAQRSQSAWQSIVDYASRFKDVVDIDDAVKQLNEIMPSSERAKLSNDISNWAKTAKQTYGRVKGGFGMTTIGALGTIAAGAAVVGGWAYPAKKLGEEIGYRIEEKRAGRRLRPNRIPVKELWGMNKENMLKRRNYGIMGATTQLFNKVRGTK